MRKLPLAMAILALAGCYSPTQRVEDLVNGKRKIAGIYFYAFSKTGEPLIQGPNTLFVNEPEDLEEFEVMRQGTVDYLAFRKAMQPKPPEHSTFLLGYGDFFWCDISLKGGGLIRYRLYYDEQTKAPVFLRDHESDICLDHEFFFIKGAPLFLKVQKWILTVSEPKVSAN